MHPHLQEEEKPDVYYDENDEEIYPVEVVDDEKEGAPADEVKGDVAANDAPVDEKPKDEL